MGDVCEITFEYARQCLEGGKGGLPQFDIGIIGGSGLYKVCI